MKFRAPFIAFLLIILALMAACNKLDKLINGVAPQIDRIDLSSYEVDPGDTLTATVIIAEGDEPMTFQWSCSAGQFLPPVDGEQVRWKAPVTGGAYIIKVGVENDIDKDKAEQELTVRSYTNPAVSITSITTGEYFTQYEVLNITATAIHDNGIRTVKLYLNNGLYSTHDGHSQNRYTFNDVQLETAGSVEIRIVAEARTTSSIGSDTVTIQVEGIILGKKQ